MEKSCRNYFEIIILKEGYRKALKRYDINNFFLSCITISLAKFGLSYTLFGVFGAFAPIQGNCCILTHWFD